MPPASTDSREQKVTKGSTRVQAVGKSSNLGMAFSYISLNSFEAHVHYTEGLMAFPPPRVT